MTPDQALSDLKRRGLLRSLRALPDNRGKLEIGGETWLNFSSNDYLDLAHHPALADAATAAVRQLGCSSGGSRLTSGHLTVHAALESALADFTGMETALVFGSGFLTNLGVIPALAGNRAQVFCDRLNHASLIDGALMSGGKWHRYRHNDTAHLETLLSRHPAQEGETRIVVTDSIFSMDGDAAPLAEIFAIARRAGALLVVDESHAIGVLGPAGAGLCAELGMTPDVLTCGMGKAFGSYGGFAACSHALAALIVNRARSFIYSTGLPPACIAASHAALGLFIEHRGALGEGLMDRARHMHALLAAADFAMPPAVASPILPVMVGDNHAALAFADRLAEKRILCGAIRPPTVPPGTARLRLTVTRAHSAADLAAAADAFAAVGRDLGVLQ
ncbi:8-amino-7-oxononanoate synthase [Oleispirillum naphthae]|uniref:aminotransferase class I/II-fold pyridoxal phosphate-dependent enzyme n=1 Tax=Oleispirillum naphthae TaxID=2838853 RepID=UPI00308264A6